MTHITESITQALQTKTLLEVVVKVNATRTAIESYDATSNQLFVSIKEPAQDNKANTALLKLLHKESKRSVRIKHGTTAKRKLIQLT